MPGNRINRAAFWLYVAMGAVLVALSAIFLPGGLWGGVGALALLVSIPRLHDIGRSGWWAVLTLVPLLVLIPLLLAQAIPQEALMWMRYGVFGAAALGLAVLGLIAGHPGSNRFGEPRRGWI